MKRQIQISLLVLLSVAGFAGAVELPGFGFYDLSQDELAAYRQGELIVRFADVDAGTQLSDDLVILGPWRRHAIKSAISGLVVAGAEVDKEYDHIVSGLAVVELPEGMSVLDALIQFNRSANVLYAEPNYKYRLFVIPDDPLFYELWGMHNIGQTDGTVDADIDAPEAWDIQTGDPEIIVAVADTGVDYTHPDLAANMWVNTDEQNGQPDVDDDGNGYVDDIYGYDFAGAFKDDPTDGDGDPCDMHFHGTHVAGTIGAVGNNGEGIVGVCWNVRMMALKVFADDHAIVPDLLVADAVEAVGYAIDNGAKIINASWGGTDYSQSLYDAIANAGDAGLLLIAAAGNDYGNDNDVYPIYPANYDLDNIISVMSTDHNDEMSDFSNFGATTVDVGEPGTGIVSTTPTYETASMMVFDVPTNYASVSGTSMATPHVAGACALVWSKYPSLPNRIIKMVLLKTVDPVLSSPRLCLSGGRINLQKALTLIPTGRSGKVINSIDPSNLYRSIQAAIDDANDGDVLIAEADTLFYETFDFKGKAITLRSGDITQPGDPTISPGNTYILGLMSEGSVVTFSNGEGPGTVLKGLNIGWGSADYGGGIRCNGASPTITDCIIKDNFAEYYGGGIDCYDSSPTIKNCTITGNRASGSSGIGGGINCEQASPVIANCLISNNFAYSVGGGIACHYASPNIFNCVIANNSALYKSGGIDLEYSSPTITNCTVVVDPGGAKDGGIFAYRDSFPVITNCILWGNGDDLYNCSATYSCIEDNDRGLGNIHLEPTFVTGPLGDYYLSQTAAGQFIDSTCVDLGDPGTDPGLQIHTFTTRTDGVPDEKVVDMGAHYLSIDDPAWEYKGQPYKQVQLIIGTEPKVGGKVVPDPNKPLYWQYEVVRLTAYPAPGYRFKTWIGTDDDSSTGLSNTVTMIGDTYVAAGAVFEQIPLYQLRTEVIGGRGTISPRHRRGESYPEGTVVTLIAIPEQGYIVDRWSGTDDDTSWSNRNTVTIDSDEDVTVLFRQPKSLYVPGQYPDIGVAIRAAYTHGDKVVVAAGTYSGGHDFMGKAITVASEHPDDPCSVAATIIESPGFPAFIFQSGEGPDSVVDGFTIQGLGDTGSIDPPAMGGIGESGEGAFGGAIRCFNGSSPTLSHLVIKDCVARGQDGEDATFIFDLPDDPEDPLDGLDGEDALDDPPEIDPEDPSTYDPNNAVDPSDPNAPIDGMNGEDGADGLPGEPGMDGMEGQPGYVGGNGGVGYGGAMYFDANSSPVILNCTIINCQAIGGDGGFGGLGQDGQDGQDGQPGQPGQDGQNGQDGFNDGADGVGGNGGAGGDGGPGGNGGAGGPGGKGGDGGEALGGAVYFGPNCRPTILHCTILNSKTRQGLGNYGGDGGNGGNGGTGADAADGGGGGDPDGEDGADGADGPGGRGGDGGIGGDMGVNGTRSWAGAIFFGENCEVSMSETIISDNATTTIVPTYTYGGGDGGDGGIGGDGAGNASGGNGGDGGGGGAGGPPPVLIPDGVDGAPDGEEPNAPNQGPGDGGAGGAGGAGGDDGAGGLGGLISVSSTTNYGGANYYEFGCKVELTDCTISGNASRQYDDTGLDGGGEYYESECEAILNRCEFMGNSAGLSGSGGGQYFNEFCSAQIIDCNYVENSSGDNGGALFCWYDCLLDIKDSDFIGNSAVGYYSSGGAIYGGGMWDWNFGKWHNGGTITVNNSYFATNRAAFGGGLYWHGESADVSIYNSIISSNNAEQGGGMYWSSGAPEIAGCSFLGNRARTRWFLPDDLIYQEYYYFGYGQPRGGGGGMFCWSSDAKIENCFITGNSSSGSGGGVYFGGDPCTPILKNCLVRRNSAVRDGGGIVSYWFTAPIISNCTIVYNRAYDPDDAKRGTGGGLSCSYESQTTLIDSILWGNTGTNGNQIAIGSRQEPTALDRPATLTVSYCDIEGGRGRAAIHIEPGRILNWLDGNIDADPLFVGSYYLSQIAAGQAADSPCVDAGSDSAVALGFDEYTTRSDGAGDVGVVDMGIHSAIGEGRSRLTVRVIGGEHGTVRPLSGSFDRFTIVKLWATVDPGYQVRWAGTDNDSSGALTNTVTMDSDKNVTVEFIASAGKTVTVPGNHPTIQEALNNAKDGDIIVVDTGTYFGGYSNYSLEVDKSVTITSRNPDDPRCVSTTIIDGYRGTNDSTNYGVLFTSNTSSNTVLNGITIQNCGGALADGGDGDRNEGHPDGYDGTPGEGAAIYIENGASPIIKNCIIRGNLIEGGNGGNGVNASDGLNAGRGGWAGWAHGGAIYCGPDSSPKFINCTIENNVASGGNGGNGGNSDGGSANYGGNWSRSQAIHYDPYTSLSQYVPGDLWEVWTWDFAFDYGVIFNEPNLVSYFGDYRWYSGYGGGAFCDIGSNVTFVSCEIIGNRTEGGMSGIGGAQDGRNLEPLVSYEMPTFGAGVYCAAESTVTFTDCIFEDNIASGLPEGVTDPNHRLDPYVGYGGGVCAENSAAVVFVDCNFVDNESDSGGGIYIDSTDTIIMDCSVTSNTALRGGGFLGVNGLTNIMSSEIADNRAIFDVNDPNDPNEVSFPANGAGLYCWLGGINIQDCNVSGNVADYSGGGVYMRDVNSSSIVNSLILNNGAGRDGGGVSANWYTNLDISNCTFVGNAAAGSLVETERTGFGGGFYCSYNSNSIVTDSIFWNNYAFIGGNAIAVGTGFKFDPRPTTLTISHSDIKDGRSAVWVDDGSVLNWGAGNIDNDPLFTIGPLGGYYLSRVDAGQVNNSPCVDAGSDYASHVGLIGYTTRTDEVPDIGRLDMGYHHPTGEQCRLCDLARDGIINFRDFAKLANRWLDDGCSKANAWCRGADITSDTHVDFRDILFLADCWLIEDTTGPVPDPSEWETEPYLTSGTSISMTAEAAFDAWGWDVEYYFECIDTGNCHDSGWQKSRTYTDTGLTQGVEYGYRVKTRDAIGNESGWSQVRYSGVDSTPPAPAPGWLVAPYAVTSNSIAMVATTAYDDSGVEYYFESVSGRNGHDSGWQDEPNYTDVDLDPNTEYSYRVRARDRSLSQNETPWSVVAWATTLVPPDITPPTPNPMEWDTVTDPNGFDGTPREVYGYGGGGSFDYWAEMRAVVATDASGVVEYFFECIDAPGIWPGGFSSGWQVSNFYRVQVGRRGQGLRFRVRARDLYHNETGWSVIERAD